MDGLWVGIIFLISSLGTYGLNDEYFNSKEACWKYFDKHPSFKIEQVYNQNHYHIHANIKKYKISEVGIAYVTCKKKMYNKTVSPFDNATPDVPEHDHNHDHNHEHKGL